MTNYFFALKLFTALGCSLVAGVLFAFSTFVMNDALARLQPKEGIAAMQSINITAINPLFSIDGAVWNSFPLPFSGDHLPVKVASTWYRLLAAW
ncbi:MAG: hypothetical protein ACYTXI_18715 [Nostoc sp.]